MVEAAVASLAPERLRWRCDPAQLGFTTTDEVQAIEAMVGQDRGLEALELGLELEAAGYNVFVAGPSGTGRSTAVDRQIQRAIADRPAAADWAYVHNFADPYQPIALQLPSGRAPELARDLENFIASCRQEIPRVLQVDRYEKRRQAILQSVQEQNEAQFSRSHALAEKLGFIIQFTPDGI